VTSYQGKFILDSEGGDGQRSEKMSLKDGVQTGKRKGRTKEKGKATSDGRSSKRKEVTTHCGAHEST